MGHYLDLSTWSRKQLFDFFIDYANPYFNVCCRIDVTNLLKFVRERSDVRVSTALHYLSLKFCNEVEPFRYRLKDKEVYVYDVVHGGTTILLPNESFAYAYFDYDQDFDNFSKGMSKAVDEVRDGDGVLRPTMRDDVVYHTTLPWMSFTSFSHARNKGRGESIPRIVFGKFSEENSRVLLPISVEVHHALMDGIAVGRFLTGFEEAAADMGSFLK
jgi:chloramphenicol O-acetyltransferase type A